MIFILKNFIVCFLNLFLFFFFYFLSIFFFISFFFFFYKILVLLFFLFFNIIVSLLVFDVFTSWYVYLELWFKIDFNIALVLVSWLKLTLIFFFDIFGFLKYFFPFFFDLKNFVGIFFHFFQLLNELLYEAVYMFIEQTEDHNMVAESNWMPQYLLGDSLEMSLRLNKIFNLFSFSDIFYEKIFVYRRVGILNSRFWLFRSYTYVHHLSENRFRRQTGTFVEPSRWLLDFRDFRISDYLDPWHFFSNKEIFRKGLFIRKKQYIAVELMHNYHSIMESVQPQHIERAYFNYHASTFLFIEYFLLFTFYTILLNLVDEHLQTDLMGLDEEEGVPDIGNLDHDVHPYYRFELSENIESQLFSNYVMDVNDYVTDENLSWDFILAQPNTVRFHQRSDFDEFELVKEMNFLLNEFRGFSFLYPIYKLIYKLSFLKFMDFFLFTDSGRGFRILFKLLIYIPVGCIIVILKSLILCIDSLIGSSRFFKFLVFFLILSIYLIYF